MIEITDHYRCLPQATYREENRCLTAWREQDIELVRVWRNAQIDVLRQKAPLSPTQQIVYFRDSIRPTFAAEQPSQILFSYLENEKLIGYGGLVHIDWEVRRGEVSFLMDTVRATDSTRYAEDFRRYFRILSRIAFEELKFTRLTSETFDIRPVHVEVLESLGFREEGRLREHVLVQGKPVDSVLHGLLRREWAAKFAIDPEL